MNGIDALVKKFVDGIHELSIVLFESKRMIINFLEENLLDLVHNVDYASQKHVDVALDSFLLLLDAVQEVLLD